MVILRKCYCDYDHYYFMTRKENGLFCFSLDLPDRESLVLCPCFIGIDWEDEIEKHGVSVSDDIYKWFNSIYDKEDNYNSVCNLLMNVFNDVNRTSLDKSFGRNDKLLDLTDKCITSYGREVYDYWYREIYDEVRRCSKIWGDDTDRIMKWVVKEKIPELTEFRTAIVDVFGEHHPTEYKLLHKFYSHWGKDLDSIIAKCIEKYPDENDFDLAIYMCREWVGKM